MRTKRLIPTKHLESIFLAAGFYGELAYFEADFPSSSILGADSNCHIGVRIGKADVHPNRVPVALRGPQRAGIVQGS